MDHYFRQADIQIGVNSTALFEGLGYDLSTFIIKLFGYQYMKDLYQNNYAKLVTESDDLFKYIVMTKFPVEKNKKKASLDYFWKRNSIENMVKEITQIMQKI